MDRFPFLGRAARAIQAGSAPRRFTGSGHGQPQSRPYRGRTWPRASLVRLDTVISWLKVGSGVTAAADPEAGPFARAFVAYEAAVVASVGLNFDDLILRAIDRLDADPALLPHWR